MTAASEFLGRLRALHPFAPAGVGLRCEVEIAENGRLTPGERRSFERLAARANARPDRYEKACAFPVLMDVGDPCSEGIEGAVLEARCLPASQASSLGGQSLDRALGEGHPLIPLLAAELADEPYQLHIVPSTSQMGCKVLDVTGGSMGLAGLIALHAALRGRPVPEGLVVSAALELGPGGLRVVPVAGARAKARVLALERPGCRFLVCPEPGQEPEVTDAIQVELLAPGPVAPLLDKLLGERPSRAMVASRVALLGLMDDAQRAYWDQRYPEAEGLYRDALRLIASKPERVSEQDAELWTYEAELRLASVEMHRGAGDAALAELDRIVARVGEVRALTQPLLVEAVTSAAAAAIDSFDPELAEQLLARVEPIERALLRTPELDMQLLALWGTRSRLHLLRGEPEQALAVQHRVVEVSPPHEQARSLTNLGECLHRCGKDQRAREVWARAREALERVEGHYRLHTEAFLVFYEGRAALMGGVSPEEARGIAEVGERFIAQLAPMAAARWRLEGMVLLARLVAGEEGVLEALIARAVGEKGAFRRWYMGLDLLRVGVLVPELEEVALGAAVTVFGEVRVERFWEVERTMKGLVGLSSLPLLRRAY